MVTMRQVDNPHWRGDAIEHFYDGYVKVQHGVVELDNPVWIEALIGRGYRVVEEVAEAPAEVAPEKPRRSPPRRNS